MTFAENLKCPNLLIAINLLILVICGCQSKRDETSYNYFLLTHQSIDTTQASAPQPSADRLSTTRPSEQVLTSSRLPELNDNSTIQTYLAYAALNNPALESAFDKWKSALQRIPQVSALPDPRFTYRYFIEEVETRVGAQKQGFGISQVFPWFGKLKLRGDIAAQQAQAAYQQYEALKLKLFYQVKYAYYEYDNLMRTIEIVRKNRDLVKYLEQVIRNRYKTSLAGHQDLIRIQTELATLEDQLIALKKLRKPVIAKLNAALGRNPAEPLPLPKTITIQGISISDKRILTLAVQNNPELKEFDYKIAASRKNIELAKKDYFPDITLGVNYTDVRAAPRSSGQGLAAPFAQRSALRLAQGMGDGLDVFNLARSFMPADRADDAGKDIWMVYVSVNLPIWYDKYHAGEVQARFDYNSAVKEKIDRQNILLADIEMTLFKLHDAERKMKLYRDILIPKEQQALKATEAAFRAGKANYNDLIDTQRKLLEFQLSYENARTTLVQQLAKLEMLVGRKIPNTNNIENKETGQFE